MSRLDDKQLNKLGRAEVERQLGTNISWDKANQKFARQWLEQLDRGDDVARQESALDISRRSNAIASEANDISRKARESARLANAIAIIATIIAIIAMIISYLDYRKP